MRAHELHESRDALRFSFIAKHGWKVAEALQPDASARSYFRLRRNGGGTAMLMDSPPQENPHAFVKVTRLLETIGARVPKIYAADMENGFLLLEDLGENTFTKLLAAGHDETALYRRAIGALSHIRKHARAHEIDLPKYDAELAAAESRLFIDWYLPARMQCATSAAAEKSFINIWREMLTNLPPLSPALVLRDFHVDNLMLVNGDCALLDYQDAVIGSPAYDLASLLEDARRDFSPAVAEEMMQLYCTQNPGINQNDFSQHYIVWAAQRHCKVAGIFTRLWLRDDKDAYLQHLPRVLNLLRRNLHAPVLSPLREWLAKYFGKVAHAEFASPRENLLQHCARK